MATRWRKKKEEETRKEAEAEEFLDERFWIQVEWVDVASLLLWGEYKGFPGRAMLELELKKREDRKKRSRSHREKKKWKQGWGNEELTMCGQRWFLSWSWREEERKRKEKETPFEIYAEHLVACSKKHLYPQPIFGCCTLHMICDHIVSSRKSTVHCWTSFDDWQKRYNEKCVVWIIIAWYEVMSRWFFLWQNRPNVQNTFMNMGVA